MKKNKEKIFTCNEEDKGKRLDIFLMEKTGIIRSEVQKMIRNNAVLLNGKRPKKAGEFMKLGYHVEILPDKEASAETDKEIKIKIIKETEDYLVLEKPTGLLVHESEAGEPRTLAAWLLQNYKKIKNVGDDKKRPGIVHRLDKDASGVMVVAKTQKMFDFLKEQFKNRTTDKEYSVLVHGQVSKEHDIIDFDIDRGVGGRMASRPKIDLTKLKNVEKEMSGKEAVTEFWVEKKYTRFSLLRVKIHTGRTHQIRVHMLSYNHPLVGDSLYFNKKLNLKKDEELGRLFLHARKLCFNDLKGERVCFESALPKELEKFLEKLN